MLVCPEREAAVATWVFATEPGMWSGGKELSKRLPFEEGVLLVNVGMIPQGLYPLNKPPRSLQTGLPLTQRICNT